jgi:hypothetical protein
VSIIASYDIEILVLICLIFLYTFSTFKHLRIRNLTKITIQEFKDYIRLIDPPDDEDEDEDVELQEIKLGMSEKYR